MQVIIFELFNQLIYIISNALFNSNFSLLTTPDYLSGIIYYEFNVSSGLCCGLSIRSLLYLENVFAQIADEQIFIY